MKTDPIYLRDTEGMENHHAHKQLRDLRVSVAHTVAQHALTAGVEIQRFFAEHPVYASKFGDFEFGVKIGLAIGETEWGIV